MINSLEINNLKCVKNIQMECRNLNVLIGTNSSGKSTILQALLLVGQNLEPVEGLNGKLVELGKFEDAKCIYSADKELDITINSDNNSCIKTKMVLDRDSESYFVHTECSAGQPIEEWQKRLSIKKRRLQYLSCHRIGPRKVYPKNMTLDDVIGIDGEYAMSYLNQHGKDIVEPEMCKGNVDFTLLGQMNWWLSYIMDSTIMTEDISGTDLIKVSYQMNDMENIRPGNIGAGISYLIAILVMCLSSPEKGVLIIENPEIHLHPSAQAKVCEFLYFIAARDRQIFVETHSDHIFNGFRVGMATKSMREELLNIQFVYLNEQHLAEAIKVKIGKRGKIENQRKDLFDQFDLDLNKMIGL
ncbi:MAG: AAA family ATPase [Lachnospiraceae bacterium]|nr:AAA family ATPase [Lachnospiraceae bacterium]